MKEVINTEEFEALVNVKDLLKPNEALIFIDGADTIITIPDGYKIAAWPKFSIPAGIRIAKGIDKLTKLPRIYIHSGDNDKVFERIK